MFQKANDSIHASDSCCLHFAFNQDGMKKIFSLLIAGAIVMGAHAQSGAIDREAVVKRHTVYINKADSLSSLTVGNGHFAFTVDVTGLQSFPDYCKNGVPLGTQSSWGWHSFPNTARYRFEESLKTYELDGRRIPYPVQWKEPERKRRAADYFRQNPHRLQLGHIGLEIVRSNGRLATIRDIKNISQQLDMWKGSITSTFYVDSQLVNVVTYVHPELDAVGVRIISPFVAKEKLRLRLQFPYPNGEWKDVGANYTNADKHRSTVEKRNAHHVVLRHALDATAYFVQVASRNRIAFKQRRAHDFLFIPNAASNVLEMVFCFTPQLQAQLPSFAEIEISSNTAWEAFWKSGGAVDFAGSTDPRASELERRVVLSQYLTRVQCAAPFPPQETGLTYNSWYGKPHLEMHWWHAVHFALWGRTELLEKSLDWYFTIADSARAIAQRQGFEGLRWQKMTDHAGREAPSSVGSFLIWQQPHFIYMAELVYRSKANAEVLNKYKDLVFATADFMASFPSYDSATGRYNLGPGIIPAQERFDPQTTFNPAFELAYWHWGLSVAQQWRERLGMERHPQWDAVLQQLAPLPKNDSVYLATESTPDCYTTEKYMTDHPAVLAAYAGIPAANGLDSSIMKNTFDLVWKVWKWEDTWGWDFPLAAMTATRLGITEKAVEALLMPVRTNTYLPNGHNYQDKRLTIYLPGNGGLLTAVAMMCAGFDGNTKQSPGYPAGWKVKWEGLHKIF